jgi:hypothetical protein
MADINQFLRSKERLVEILHDLRHSKFPDANTLNCIIAHQDSIRILDEKIEEYLNLNRYQSTNTDGYLGLA